MRCREPHDPFTKLGQNLFALHSVAARFRRMITFPGRAACKGGCGQNRLHCAHGCEAGLDSRKATSWAFRWCHGDFAPGIAWADPAWLGRQWSSRIETGVWHRELSMYFLPMERGKSKVKARRATSMPVSGKQSQPH